MENLDWDDARYFLAVARSGSLSAASRRLGCSHSTVRRRIEALQQSMGVELFVSASEGLSLTDAAKDVLPLAEQLEEAATRFARKLTGQAQAFTGRIVVTTIDVLAASIAGAVVRFTAEHPQVELQLLTANRYVDLSRREADVAIRVGASPDQSLVGRKVGYFRFAPFAATTLIERCGRDPAKMPWILFDERSRATLTEAWYLRVAPGRSPVLRVSNAGTLITMARAGVGGAIMPLEWGQKLGLEALGPELEDFKVDVWCLTHPDLRYSARIKAFMQCVAEEADFRFGEANSS